MSLVHYTYIYGPASYLNFGSVVITWYSRWSTITISLTTPRSWWHRNVLITCKEENRRGVIKFHSQHVITNCIRGVSLSFRSSVNHRMLLRHQVSSLTQVAYHPGSLSTNNILSSPLACTFPNLTRKSGKSISKYWNSEPVACQTPYRTEKECRRV